MATGISKSKWKTKIDLSTMETSSIISLSYAGKRTEHEILARTPAQTQLLWQGPAQPRNHLYYGDNLAGLATLLHESQICGHVRLVYIDPPFATKQVFQSRQQQDAYEDLLAGPHYLEFLRQRLIFLRELLAHDGSIYVHLDMNMACQVKILMDEIFGEKCFRNWITRKKCNPKNYTRKTYGNISDYILFYTKSDEYIWNRPYKAWTQEQALKEYQYIEEKTGRRYKKVPLHAPGERHGETGKPWRDMNPPSGKHWQYPPQTLDEMDARGEIYWSANGNPRRKVYLDQSLGIPIQDIWLDYKDAHNQNIKITGYPTEKIPDLLSLIINASSDPDDIVLDCFAGSGTTLDLASKHQRRWIGMDNSPEAISTILKRFTTGLEPMGDYVNKEKESQLSFLDATLPAIINNFACHAIEPYEGELDTLFREWQGLNQFTP